MDGNHTGLKILGALTTIGGVLSVLAGIFYLSVGSALENEALESILLIIPLLSIGIAMALMGGVLLVIGLFFTFLGVHLYQHRSWAYWTYFVLTALGLLFSLVSFAWLGIIIGGLICWYLYGIRSTFMSGGDIQFTYR